MGGNSPRDRRLESLEQRAMLAVDMALYQQLAQEYWAAINDPNPDVAQINTLREQAQQFEQQLAQEYQTARLSATEWAVQVLPGQDHRLNQVFNQLPNFQGYDAYSGLENTYILKFGAGGAGIDVNNFLRERMQIGFVDAQVRAERAKMYVPNDPLFQQQWHLNNTGQSGGTPGQDAKLPTAWDLAFGNGVTIAIVDDGLQGTHPDLANNYIAALGYDYVDYDSDPSPELAEDGHGTAVAGVAAARGGNSVGVIGAAPLAGLAGIRLIAGPISDLDISNALTHQLDSIDISNNSWGNIFPMFPVGELPGAALETGVTTGRDGLGTIYVFAAGNDQLIGGNVNYQPFALSRYTIAVAAIDHNGIQSYYSNPGAALLVSAYSNSFQSGITTTDLIGEGGYSPTEYTDEFGGTSSAAPLVSGVVALMLEANPNLTWRDVQHILVNTAAQNHASDSDWVTNGAGFLVNHKYGFGAIDATAAVQAAASWLNVAPEASFQTAVQNVDQEIVDEGPAVTSTINVDSNISIESVEITINLTHTFRGDLEIILTSPSGTQSVLQNPHFDGMENINWTFTSLRHWGESPQGTWTISVRDDVGFDSGNFTNWQLSFHGTGGGDSEPPVAVDDIAFTDEDEPVEIRVLDNDTDPDSEINPASVRIVQPPPHGTIDINRQTGAITYTPGRDQFGVVTFTYTVQDTGGATSNAATVTVLIAPVNDPPYAITDNVSLDEDTSAIFDVLANDYDVDSTMIPATLTIITPPQHGTAVITPDFKILYTPNPDYFGPDTIRYTVADDEGAVSEPGLVNITVNPVNDAPVAVEDFVTLDEDVPTWIDILANDYDIDSLINTGSVQVLGGPSNGSLAFDPTTGRVLYTPTGDFYGSDAFAYRVQDVEGLYSNAVMVYITVLPVNDAPVAVTDQAVTPMDQPVLIPLLANDYDVDSPLLPSSLEIIRGPQYGSIIIDSFTGSVFYSPNAGYEGADTIVYRIADDQGAVSAPGHVQIRVGAPISIAGSVFVDHNGNGIQDPTESGIPNVMVRLHKTDGLLTFTETRRTDINGHYVFTEVPGGNLLPAGTYSVEEVHPVIFLDGDDWDGIGQRYNTIGQDQIPARHFAAGTALGGYNFTERGLRAEFIDGFLGRRVFFASASTSGFSIMQGVADGLDLSTGDVWYTLDDGVVGQLDIQLHFDPTGGNARVIVYDASLQPLAEASGAGPGAALRYTPPANQPVLVRVTGTNKNVSLQVNVSETPTITRPAGVGVFRADTAWFFLRDTADSGLPDVPVFTYGGENWIPLVGDWNGDGVDTPGVYDPGSSTFYLRNSNSAGGVDYTPILFGQPGWLPLVGDWDGDGIDTIGLYNSATATFFLRNSNSTGVADVQAFNYGMPGWVPIAGDWNGDGIDTVGVYNSETSTFFLRNSNTAGVAHVAPFTYGAPGWKPVVGDWNNDGRDTIGVFDPGSATFYLRDVNSSGVPTVPVFSYGGAGWTPLVGRWTAPGTTTPAAMLVSSAAMSAPQLPTTAITQADALPALHEAVARWKQIGLTAASASLLDRVTVHIADLPAGMLGMTSGTQIYLDADAATRGWFVDLSPELDEEFDLLAADGRHATSAEAAHRYDLLTVLGHELGHVLGLNDVSAATSASNVMADQLAPGVRRSPSASGVDRFFASRK